MLKGKLEIDIYDKDGNLKQHEEGENLITNHTYDLLKNALANKDFNVLLTDSSNLSKLFVTDLTPEFEGILLFNNLLIEDADNYFKQLMTCKEVGHAGSGATVYEYPKSGTINSTASEITENSIKKVWIFGQGKAVGTIQSVALTNNALGTKGIEDYNFKTITTDGTFLANNTRLWSKAVSTFLRFKNEAARTPNITYYDSSIFDYIRPIMKKNGIIYCVYVNRSGNTTKFDIHKINLNEFYKKTSFMKYAIPHQSNNRYADFISKTTGENPDYTYSTESASTSGYNSYKVYAYNNKICFSLYNKNNIPKIVEFDINTELFTEIQSPQQYTGVQYSNRHAIKNSKGIFLASNDANKIAQFTENFVFMQFIELPEELVAASGSQVPIVLPYDNDLLLLQFSKNNYQTVCLTDLSNYKFIEGNNNLYNLDFGFETDEKQTLPLAIEASTSNLGSYVNNMYISTIKNLENPITKGTDDVMNVTYTIIKQD